MKKIIIQFFVSGFGWEIYKKYGFLDNLLSHSAPLESVLGFSSATDPSLFCGEYPQKHGHWFNYYYDKKRSPFKNLSLMYNITPAFFQPLFYVEKIKKLMEKIVKNNKRYTGSFNFYNMPLGYLKYFNYKGKKSYFSTGAFQFCDSIFDQLSFRSVQRFISFHSNSDEKNCREAIKVIKKGEVSYVFVYLPNLDSMLHGYGLEHEIIEEKLAFLEKLLRRTYKVAQGIYQEVDICVYSNHGMADVHHLSNLPRQIEKLPFQYGEDYLAIYDGTIARFWFYNPQSCQGITNFLSENKTGTILSDAELQKMGVFFPHKKFGELIFLLKPHFLMVPSHFYQFMVRGMHGYNPQDPYSHALLLSNNSIDANITSITDIKKMTQEKLKSLFVDEREQS